MAYRFAVTLLLGSACAKDLPTGSDALVWKRILFVGIRSEDQAAQTAWYRSSLGFVQGGDVWFVLTDQSSIEMLPGGVASTGTKSPAEQPFVTAFQVADLDAHVSDLSGRGVTFLGDVEEADDARFVNLADPEGNQLQIRELDDAATGEGYLWTAWSGLTVERFDETVAWYRDVLGLTPGATGVFHLLDGATLEILGGGSASITPKSSAQQSTVLGIELADLDAAIAELEERGVDVGGEIYEWESEPWPSERWIEISDPEGNEILVKEITD